MNAPLWLWNLGAYSLQVALLIAASAALAALFRMRAPRAMLFYWHGVLALALLLPAIQPWRHAELPAGTVTITEGPAYIAGQPIPQAAAPVRTPAQPSRAPFDTYRAIALLLAAGVAARLAWLGVGLARLSLYRRKAKPLDPVPEALGRAMLRTAACPDFYLSEEFDPPITFGALRPAVLLPARFLEFEPALQDAIATHELLHVRRRDWLFVLGEELVRAALWFHPAVWWLLGRIQLTREQAVDAETIELTEGRQHYLAALLEIAKLRRPVAALAPLFLRKRHFTQRVKLIVKEIPMSRSRLILTFVLMIAALVPAAGFVMQTFPLEGQPVAAAPPPAPAPAPEPVVASPAPVTAPAPLPATPAAQIVQEQFSPRPVRVGANLQPPNLIRKVTPVYPPEARQAGIQGEVQAEVVIGTDGAIKEITAISGPPILVKAAEDAVRQWKYIGNPVEVLTQVTVNFTPSDAPITGKLSLLSVRKPFYPTEAQGSGVQGMVRFKAYIAPDGTVRDLVYLEGDQLLVAAAENAARQARFAPPGKDAEAEIALSVTPDSKGGLMLFVPPPPPPPLPPPPEGVERISVAPMVQAAQLLEAPTPVYPPRAQQARIQGTVRFQVLIGTDGTVKRMLLVSGHPLLVPASQDAVKQYRYQPTFIAGKPAEVVTQVDVNFTLQ